MAKDFAPYVEEPVKTKVHKVTVLIVDHDDLGAEGVWDALENTRYANRCINPDVMAIQTTEVDWTDEHPLNYSTKKNAEFDRLFPAEPK